jgi:large-conductance mechanosensitive channel
MSNSNETTNADSNNINTKQVIKVICLVVLVVVGFYFFNFNDRLSEKNEVWGTFGDYFGGILNPVIAAFAFYLIAKTYDLQKRELEATRSLLKVSTDAQEKQIKLAALTALLNSNLMRIDMLKSEKISLLQGTLPEPKDPGNQSEDSADFKEGRQSVLNSKSTKARKIDRVDKIESEINSLTEKNNKLEEQIEAFWKEKTE